MFIILCDVRTSRILWQKLEGTHNKISDEVSKMKNSLLVLALLKLL